MFDVFIQKVENQKEICFRQIQQIRRNFLYSVRPMDKRLTTDIIQIKKFPR